MIFLILQYNCSWMSGNSANWPTLSFIINSVVKKKESKLECEIKCGKEHQKDYDTNCHKSRIRLSERIHQTNTHVSFLETWHTFVPKESLYAHDLRGVYSRSVKRIRLCGLLSLPPD
jgi:hypothetical protein